MVFAAALGLAAPAAVSAGEPAFPSVSDALARGISAYKEGAYDEALPALEFAAAGNEFLAHYYLAKIHSDNSGAYTDHAKAYLIYQRIADEHTDADPDDDRRAPFVGKSLTALAGYVRTGLPGVVEPNLSRAIEYLRYAALFFRDEDAQFELAKIELAGQGGDGGVETAKHWLSVLSQKGHAGAQAFLADLYWRGHHMERDPVRALVLIAIAVANAPVNERVWIEDIYQNVYCSTSAETRAQAEDLAPAWRNRYLRKPAERGERLGAASLDLRPQRTCEDDEPVTLIGGDEVLTRPSMKSAGAAGPSFLEGSASDLMRGVGDERPAATSQ